MNTVASAIKRIGLSRIAQRFDVWPSAVQKWRDRGRLPKSELAGLTNYAEGIAELDRATKEPIPVTKKELLRDTRTAWEAKD
jgi:hypothetical protein